MKRIALAFLAAGFAGLAVAPEADAVLILSISSSLGGPGVAIEDGQAGDTDGLVNGAIAASTTLVNGSITGFEFSSLGASSNQLFGTPGSNDPATLSQEGQVSNTGGAVGTVTIVATDTDYFFPAFDPKSMASSATFNFTGTQAGDSHDFQSFFNPDNTAFSQVIPSPLIAVLAPAGVGPFAGGANAAPTLLPGQPLPFGLTNVTNITLGPETIDGVAPSNQFTGATTITAIPEPGTWALAILGLPAVLVARRYGRRVGRVAVA